MAFLGDIGKFFGLGSSEEVLGTAGRVVGTYVAGPAGGEVGARIGASIGDATSSLAGGGTADQPAQQSAVPTPRPEDLLVRQETPFSGTKNFNDLHQFNPGSRQMQSNQAFISPFGSLVGGLPSIARGVQRFFSSPTGVGTAVGTGLGLATMGDGMRVKPTLTQSRRMKSKVRRLAEMVGIPGAAQILSQSLGKNVTEQDVIMLLLRTFRNDGAYITKAQVRNLGKTTRKFKRLEKQVKEATSMTRTTRRSSPMRRAGTTLISNK